MTGTGVAYFSSQEELLCTQASVLGHKDPGQVKSLLLEASLPHRASHWWKVCGRKWVTKVHICNVRCSVRMYCAKPPNMTSLFSSTDNSADHQQSCTKYLKLEKSKNIEKKIVLRRRSKWDLYKCYPSNSLEYLLYFWTLQGIVIFLRHCFLCVTVQKDGIKQFYKNVTHQVRHKDLCPAR